ncbi:hypothetical protein [Methylorubrum sp. SL192]|uniref:hypothetical protein n=1 Tax=Methylorubrum sp. SL192 TaxID=2995167 RepID=UPI002274F7B4|nr:hypothetical protein [Methylorubrum sp. SL192]MCY1640676.1 hypothetical protein [Methylorubrum sp. SL192]
MNSETAKLPRGQSYPLKPSIMEAALKTAHVSIDTHLVRGPGKIFSADFWPPNPNVPHERLYVRIGSVPAEQAQAARDRFERAVVPALVAWIGNILALDPQSPVRREKQRLSLNEF